MSESLRVSASETTSGRRRSGEDKLRSFSRREFLRMLGLGAAGAALTGCRLLKAGELLVGLGTEPGSADTVNEQEAAIAPAEEPAAKRLPTVAETTQPSVPEAAEEELVAVVEETRELYPYESLLAPVSQTQRLPESFPRQEAEVMLTSVDRQSGQPVPAGAEGVPIAELVSLPVQDMFNAARNEGLQPYLRSGFRDIGTQEVLFENNVKAAMAENGLSREEAEALVNQSSARPGYSEHHTGFAMDVLDMQYGGYTPGDSNAWDLARQHYQEGLYGWLRQHAHEHGFVISYPTGLSINEAKFTSGYPSAEPWHLRFIGIPLANYLHEQDYLNPGNDVTLDQLLAEIAGE